MGRNHGGRYKLVAVRERTEVPCFLTSHMDGCQSGLLSFFAKEMLLQNNHRFKSCTILHLFLGSSMVEHLTVNQRVASSSLAPRAIYPHDETGKHTGLKIQFL